MMDVNKEEAYSQYLASASEALLSYLESGKFINWAIGSLFDYLKPSHVSVALFDPKYDAFLIKYSVGAKRFPSQFIRLQRTSAIVEWFSAHPPEKITATVAPEKHSVCIKLPGRIRTELSRHSSSACVQIKSPHLGGYLLVGESQTMNTYTERDQIYFQTVANDIAVEIEKQHYYKSASFDPLTNLLNRQSLLEKLEFCIHLARKTDAHFSLCMVDLDNFKKINDSYGHPAGDEVLRAAAKIFQKGVRETDFVFRYGGEEFLIILWGQSRHTSKVYSSKDFERFARKAIERLRLRLATQTILCSQHSLNVTASIGMTFFNGNSSKTAQQIIEEADRAVYVSKHSGKNRVTLYKPDISSQA